MVGNQVPPEIVALIQKGASGTLTESERRMLSGFAVSSRGQVNRQTLDYIDTLIGGATDWTAEASALTPSTAPSVAEEVATSQAAATGGVDWKSSLGGSPGFGRLAVALGEIFATPTPPTTGAQDLTA